MTNGSQPRSQWESIGLAALTLVIGLLTSPAYAQAICAGRADGASCDDGNVCTAADTCHAGGCAGMLVDDGVRISRLAPGDATAVISWSRAPGATGSDVLRGQINALPISPTDNWETVLARDTDATTYQDEAFPVPGVGFWYLVRGRTRCGPGAWGFQSLRGIASTQREPREACAIYANASPRYVDQGWTVMDLRTCLQWEKKNQPGESAIHDVSFVDSYNGAHFWIDAVNAEFFAGYADWRLPTSDGSAVEPTNDNPELDSLVDFSHSPRIDPIFGPTSNTVYWSSSRYRTSIGDYWGVDFQTGFMQPLNYADRVPMRAVRGEVMNPPPE